MGEGSSVKSVKTLSEVDRGKELQPMKHKKLRRTENPQQSLNVETSTQASPHMADQLGNIVHDGTEGSQNFLVHWIRKLLTTSLPFYWIIVVIGILGLTSLVCGVMLGAFICTNRHHNFPFFFWSTSRIGRAVY